MILLLGYSQRFVFYTYLDKMIVLIKQSKPRIRKMSPGRILGILGQEVAELLGAAVRAAAPLQGAKPQLIYEVSNRCSFRD